MRANDFTSPNRCMFPSDFSFQSPNHDKSPWRNSKTLWLNVPSTHEMTTICGRLSSTVSFTYFRTHTIHVPLRHARILYVIDQSFGHTSSWVLSQLLSLATAFQIYCFRLLLVWTNKQVDKTVELGSLCITTHVRVARRWWTVMSRL